MGQTRNLEEMFGNGFSRSELNRIQEVIHLNQNRLREAWHEYFGD